MTKIIPTKMLKYIIEKGNHDIYDALGVALAERDEARRIARQYYHAYNFLSGHYIELSNQLATTDEPEKKALEPFEMCEWVYENGYWNTSCEQQYSSEIVTYRYKYCCYCGKLISAKLK